MHTEALAKNRRAPRTIQDKIASNLRHVASLPAAGDAPNELRTASVATAALPAHGRLLPLPRPPAAGGGRERGRRT